MTTTEKGRAAEVAKGLERYVNSVLLATVLHEHRAAIADRVETALLAEREWAGTDYERQCDGKATRTKAIRITEPRQSFLMNEELWPEYHAELDRRKRAAGLIPEKEGNCAALEADTLRRQAESVLLDAAGEYLPGVDHDIYGDNRKKMIDLLIKLVVNAPGYVPVKVPTAKKGGE